MSIHESKYKSIHNIHVHEQESPDYTIAKALYVQQATKELIEECVEYINTSWTETYTAYAQVEVNENEITH